MSDTNRLDRRSVLETVGAAAGVAMGLGATAGTAAAIETKHRLAQAYGDESSVRAAFERHGGALRETLVAEGVVDAGFDFGDLAVEIAPDESGLEPSAADGLAGVSAVREDGEFTAFVSASTSTETHDLALFVQPERGVAYALAEPTAGDRRVVVTESGTGPAGCTYTECTSCCSEDYRTEKTYDCCYTEECYLVDTSCDCFDCDCGDKTTC